MTSEKFKVFECEINPNKEIIRVKQLSNLYGGYKKVIDEVKDRYLDKNILIEKYVKEASTDIGENKIIKIVKKPQKERETLGGHTKFLIKRDNTVWNVKKKNNDFLIDKDEVVKLYIENDKKELPTPLWDEQKEKGVVNPDYEKVPEWLPVIYDNDKKEWVQID